jgi:hypothetical protein
MPPFAMPEPGRLPGHIRRCRRILILPPAMHIPPAKRGAELIVLRNLVLATAIMAGTVLFSLQKLNAFELTGAWTTSADKCGKVFARKGRANQVNFTNFSGAHGGGFIAEANRLRGKSDSCLIKSKKESDQSLNLVVMCGSGVMLSSVQFFLKVLDDDTISREFPGMEGMDVKYHRCRI